MRRFKPFQIRWKEPLGFPDCPYLYRWTFIFFGYSIRIHHWLRSDDCRHFHDHSANLISIVLRGYYWNVKPTEMCHFHRRDDTDYCRSEGLKRGGNTHFRDCTYCYVEGMFNSWRNFFKMKDSIWFSKATDRHWLCIPKGGAWTLLLEGKPYHKWGFYVNGHKWRPLRYFNKFGIIQTKEYQ